jgi:hypothetical protein
VVTVTPVVFEEDITTNSIHDVMQMLTRVTIVIDSTTMCVVIFPNVCDCALQQLFQWWQWHTISPTIHSVIINETKPKILMLF